MKSLILSFLFCTSALVHGGPVPWNKDAPEYPTEKVKLQQIEKCVDILYGTHIRDEKDYDSVFISFCEELTTGYFGA